MSSRPNAAADTSAEVQELRVRVQALEHELVEQATRTNALVAEAQENAYWLERWGVDLNRVMRRPVAARAQSLWHVIRPLARLLRSALRRLR